jgi:hypothetical protein
MAIDVFNSDENTNDANNLDACFKQAPESGKAGNNRVLLL